MKILYGIQGTGNGHLSRGRMLAKYFAEQGADVTYVFSGRERERFFDMGIFGDFHCYSGFTFTIKAGKVQFWQTFKDNKVLQFFSDVRNLDVSQYDVIISDFEPVVAWAGKLAGKKVIGIGHQYAFAHKVPVAGSNPVADMVMKFFAPVSIGLGLHWHHFGQQILPPIIDVDIKRAEQVDEKKIVVYLPFEDQAKVTQLLNQSVSDFHFMQYSPDLVDAEDGKVSQRKTNLHGFKADLKSCAGVICNAGFELASECLHLGVPLLVKPLHGQMEQNSNALALQQLNYGQVMQDVELELIESWLQKNKNTVDLHYKDVAKNLVDWVLDDCNETPEQLVARLW